MEIYLLQAFVFFASAAIAVPLAKKIGLGVVPGYLIAGIILGPSGLSLIGEVEAVMHFTEFGVVMMLFIIGLEMKPSLLWKMRTKILGLGGGQVALTTAVIGSLLWISFPWQQALALGLILSLSSAAIVLQLLKEQRRQDRPEGEAILSVVLLHDLAVVPIIAVLPLLSNLEIPHAEGAHEAALIDLQHLSRLGHVLVILLAINLLVVVGRYALRPVFRAIARTNMRELFSAASLALVVGSALLMMAVGLPAPLGTFLAGVILADSEYKHELESNIEPFKGLLLGIFFISIGASLDFQLVAENGLFILGLVLILVVVKFAILYLMSRFTGLADFKTRGYFSIGLAQGGTFAFVLLPFAIQAGVVPPALADLALAAVVISMFLAPLMVAAWHRSMGTEDEAAEGHGEEAAPVIIAGFGRLGTDLGRLLISAGVRPVILDHDPDNVQQLRRLGFEAHYGDITRLDLLHAAGIERAKVLVITITDHQRALELIHLVKKHFHHIQIAVSTESWASYQELRALDVSLLRRESIGSALDLGADCLELLGMRPYKAQRLMRAFIHHEEEGMAAVHEAWKGPSREGFVTCIQEHGDKLRMILRQRQEEYLGEVGGAWAGPEDRGER